MTEHEEDESRSRRRIALLLLVAIVIVVGAGIGSVTLLGPDEPTGTAPDPSTPASTSDDEGTAPTPGRDTPGDGEESTPDSGTPPDETTPTAPGAGTPTAPDTETATGSAATPAGAGPQGSGAGGGADGSTPETTVDVSLATESPSTLLRAEGVYPGEGGVARLTLRNTGDRAGRVRLAETSIVDRENGIVGSEASVDDSPDRGELSSAVAVRMYFAYPDGENVTVVGTQSDRVPLSTVRNSTVPPNALSPGGSMTVTLDWQVAPGAGNEIQSDAAVFDAMFELRAPEP